MLNRSCRCLGDTLKSANLNPFLQKVHNYISKIEVQIPIYLFWALRLLQFKYELFYHMKFKPTIKEKLRYNNYYESNHWIEFEILLC